jgi:hypothetical protein
MVQVVEACLGSPRLQVQTQYHQKKKKKKKERKGKKIQKKSNLNNTRPACFLSSVGKGRKVSGVQQELGRKRSPGKRIVGKTLL